QVGDQLRQHGHHHGLVEARHEHARTQRGERDPCARAHASPLSAYPAAGASMPKERPKSLSSTVLEAPEGSPGAIGPLTRTRRSTSSSLPTHRSRSTRRSSLELAATSGAASRARTLPRRWYVSTPPTLSSPARARSRARRTTASTPARGSKSATGLVSMSSVRQRPVSGSLK